MSTRRPGAADLLVVSVGGAAGALLRLGIDTAAPGSLFPWPTLVINVVGAFALGVLPALPVVRRSRAVALALGPGLLGGFTTVSAWAGQVRALAADGHLALAGPFRDDGREAAVVGEGPVAANAQGVLFLHSAAGCTRHPARSVCCLGRVGYRHRCLVSMACFSWFFTSLETPRRNRQRPGVFVIVWQCKPTCRDRRTAQKMSGNPYKTES